MLYLLAHYLSQVSPPAEAPTIQVSLVTPPTRAKPPEARPRHVRNERRLSGRSLRPQVSDLPAAIALPTDGREAGAVARHALRGLRDCDRRDLSREERERCEVRRWASVTADQPRLNFDVHGRYAEDPEPFLSRRPKKGCRIRATGDADVMGDSGAARAGVTCVIPF
jgi:hypothetical protein